MYVKAFEAEVKNDKVVSYRAVAKISFLVQGSP